MRLQYSSRNGHKALAMQNRKPIDEKTGFDVNEDFERFDQRYVIYCRSDWDPEIQSKNATDFFAGYYMPNARAR